MRLVSFRDRSGQERGDFELELAAVIGADGEIAGFTLLKRLERARRPVITGHWELLGDTGEWSWMEIT